MCITYVRGAGDGDGSMHPMCATTDPLTPDCFSDADFAGDKTTRWSTSGLAIMLCGGIVVASSRRQTTVADSTTAAETIALHALVKEVLWVRNMLEWTGYKQEQPITLWCDNNSAVRNSREGTERNKTKHMDIKYMFIQDIVWQGLITVRHVGTSHMVADVS